MKNILTAILLIGFIFIIGCRSKNENSSNPPVEISEDSTANLFNYSYKDLESNPIYTEKKIISSYYEYEIKSPQIDCSIEGKNDVFHCVKYACSIAGAEWIDSEKFCQCPAGQIWTITPESKCIDIQNSFKVVEFQDKNNKFYNYSFKNENQSGYFFKISTSSPLTFNKNIKLKWNPTTFAYENVYYFPITYAKETLERFSNSQVAQLNFLNSLFKTGNLVNSKDNFDTIYTNSNIARYYSDDKIFSEMFNGIDYSKNEINTENKLLNIAINQYILGNINIVGNYKNSYFRLGCLILCTNLRILNTLDSKYRIEEYTEYISGNFSRRNILLFETKSLLPIGIFNLSPRNQVNYYILVNKNDDITINKSEIEFNLYAQDNNLIYKLNYHLKKSNLLNTSFEEKIKKFRTKIITTENSNYFYEPSTEYKYKNLILKLIQNTIVGPFYSNEPKFGTSASGWVFSNEINEFYTNKPYTEFGPILFDSKSDSLQHSLIVNGLIVENYDSIGLIPDFIYSTLNGNEDYIKQKFSYFKKYNIRIINNSASAITSKIDCNKNYPFFRDFDFLTISAAGNEGLRDQTSIDKICPFNIIPSKKQIVVGSFDEPGKPSEWSNLNPTFVDILADGYYSFESETKKEHGTSFSAPRVTHTAALIQMKYPNLSNDQIRLSILMSATYNKDYPVKSRGHLNQDDALIFADKLNQKLSSRYPEIYKTADFETDILLFPDDNNLEDMKNIITEFYSPVSKTLVKTKLIILDKVIK